MVHIAHSNGYETMYLHLSRMFVHAGEHVEIGKTIGLVGSTGLATGPIWISGSSRRGNSRILRSWAAALRSRREKKLAGICGRARSVAAGVERGEASDSG